MNNHGRFQTHIRYQPGWGADNAPIFIKPGTTVLKFSITRGEIRKAIESLRSARQPLELQVSWKCCRYSTELDIELPPEFRPKMTKKKSSRTAESKWCHHLPNFHHSAVKLTLMRKLLNEIARAEGSDDEVVQLLDLWVYRQPYRSTIVLESGFDPSSLRLKRINRVHRVLSVFAVEMLSDC